MNSCVLFHFPTITFYIKCRITTHRRGGSHWTYLSPLVQWYTKKIISVFLKLMPKLFHLSQFDTFFCGLPWYCQGPHDPCQFFPRDVCIPLVSWSHKSGERTHPSLWWTSSNHLYYWTFPKSRIDFSTFEHFVYPAHK